jgi:glycosyltransferase involved in cell wall biosynthesis
VEKYVISQINELCKRGYQVGLYTNAITEFMKSLMPKSVKYFTPWSEKTEDDISKMNEFKPDLVAAHPFYSITRGLEIAEKFNSKLVVTMHGLYNFGFDASPLGAKLRNKVSKVIAVDNAAYNILKDSPNCPREKLLTIYNGIDVNRFKPKKPDMKLFNKLKLNKNYKTLVVVTRYDDCKEIPAIQLANTLPYLAQKLSGLNVVFVGGGRQIHQIEEAINKIDKTNLNIAMTGSVENVEDYMNLADFICASARTAVEAIACGKHVMQMGIGKWGVLIDKNNWQDTLFGIKYYTDYTNEQLGNHLFWFFSQKDSIDLATEGLTELIRNECDIEKIMDKIEMIYKGEI